MSLSAIGNNAMWDVGLRILPTDEGNREHPVVVRVTDHKRSQISITRINGIPVLVGSKNNPERFSKTAIDFQSRRQSTPASSQTVIRNDE